MSEATLTPEASTKHVGRRVIGLTNAQLAAGRGTYVSDVSLPGMTWMAFLRSPHAHARIRSLDASAARARPGVVLVLTGEDAQRDMNPIPEGWNTREIGAKGVEWYPIVSDRVRYVGEIVAAVVAEDRWTASAALDDIVVDYEELRAVIDPIAAMQPGADLVEPSWGDNLLITRDWRAGDVDAAFADATHVIDGTVRSNRITGVSIEGRGCVASWDPYLERLTFWESTQNPHPLRSFLAETLELPEGSIHVIQPHVGGAFGLKQPPFQEEPVVAYASRVLGRPVKWIEERWENFQATGHSRDTRFEYEVACDSEGRVSGLRVRTIADVGAPTALLGLGPVVRDRLQPARRLRHPERPGRALRRRHEQVPLERRIAASARTPSRSSWTGSWTTSRARRGRPRRGPDAQLHPARGLPALATVGRDAR